MAQIPYIRRSLDPKTLRYEPFEPQGYGVCRVLLLRHAQYLLLTLRDLDHASMTSGLEQGTTRAQDRTSGSDL